MARKSNDMDEPSDTTPLSPRVSDVSNGSRYMAENDFMVSPPRSPASVVSGWSEGRKRAGWSGKVRHAVGIALLLATVFLWTASNFLASVSCPYSELLIPSEVIWRDCKTGRRGL
jgi:solute carrier family 35 protein F5